MRSTASPTGAVWASRTTPSPRRRARSWASRWWTAARTCCWSPRRVSLSVPTWTPSGRPDVPPRRHRSWRFKEEGDQGDLPWLWPSGRRPPRSPSPRLRKRKPQRPRPTKSRKRPRLTRSEGPKSPLREGGLSREKTSCDLPPQQGPGEKLDLRDLGRDPSDRWFWDDYADIRC